MFVMMMKYAAEKHYLPYNPFTGTVLSVKKGGVPPVDRSEFFVSPEQFRWMMNDSETPNYVKTMMLLAYTTGLRSSEFLGLMWDDIDFDGSEPMINVRRGVDGKHVQKTKTEKSKAPVPMCDRVGAALLCYRDEYPSVGGWVFGSLRTGRPLHRTQVGADYLLPALWRMAAKFKLRIPEGTGFHAFRQVGADDPKRVKEVQMQLMRHTDERVNDRYGKSAAPLRERARQAHANVTELVMGVN